MKILQLIQKPQRRGAEIFACQLSKELKALGHEVEIVYIFDHPEFELDFELSFKALHGDSGRRFTDWQAYRRLAEIVEGGGFDLIQANAGDTLKYAVLSRIRYGWKTPLVFRNANKMSEFMRGQLHRILNRWFLSECDYFISVSENCRQDLVALYPAADRRSSTVTIGTYTFEDVLPSKKPDHPVLINIGGLVPEKNQKFLVDVLADVRKEIPDVSLWLFGEGRMRHSVEVRANEQGLKDAVVFWGNRPDVIRYLKAADVMVMPSLIEGLPAVILEAMSCRIPVVASPVGGIPEVIINAETGFVPSSYDPREYATVIVRILRDDNLKNSITERAYQFVRKNFLMQEIASGFLECYKKIAVH